MNYTPFTYLIGWKHLNKFYYGVRYAKDCHPSDLWSRYFTSSKQVHDYATKYGNPDIIMVRKTFKSRQDAINWETKVCNRLNVKDDPRWLNQHNGDGKFIAPTSCTEIHKRNVRKAKLGVTYPQESIQKRVETWKAKYSGSNNPNLGRKHTLEARLNMSKARKGLPSTFKGKTHSVESRKRMSASRLGNPSKAKVWLFMKDNQRVEIFNLKNYCKSNNLSINCMTRVAKGLKTSYQGFTACRE